MNRRGKSEDSYLTVRTEQTRPVNIKYLLYISLVHLRGSRTISIQGERLQISEARRKQTSEFEIVVNSFACFSTQLKKKKGSFLITKHFGNKNSLAGRTVEYGPLN